MKYCDLAETPEFQHIVDNLRDTFGMDAEKIAFKNYLENGGNFSTPDEIVGRERNEYFSPVADTETKKAWQVLDHLQKLKLISQKRVDWSADVIYRQAGEVKALNPDYSQYKIADNDVILSVPRIYTERNAAKNASQEKNSFAGDKDVAAYEELKRYLDENDVDFIKTLEFKNSYIITMDKAVYDKARSDRNAAARNKTTSYLRETDPQTALILGLNDYSPDYLSKWSNEGVVGLEMAKQYAKVLSEQVGIDYDFILADEAYTLTKDSKNPWNGEKAFFVGGKVYFVGDRFNQDSILHEFSHPLIRGIAKENQPLFNSLYDDLASTKKGKEIIELVTSLYPELDHNEDLFKEEALVRSLTEAHRLEDAGLKEVPEFSSFIDKLLYQFKRLLRRVFGAKIPVSKLDVNTTLKDLADMLKAGDKFEINEEQVTNEDIIAYEREYKRQINDLVSKDLDFTEVEKLTNEYFDLTKKQIQRLIKVQDFPSLLEIVKNKYKAGELEKITKNLKPWQSVIIQDAIDISDKAELTRHRAIAVINSLGGLANMLDKMHDGLKEIIKDTNNPDNIRKIEYYQQTIKYWEDFVKTASDVLEVENVKIPAIERITNSMKQASNLVEKFYENTVGDIIYGELEHAGGAINKKWLERKESLEKKGTTEALKILADEKKIYELQKITPEEIKKALKGNIKDMSFAGKWLESYGYSPNPIVGGTSLFIKNALTDVDAQAQKNVHTQADELSPFLKDYGYDANKAKNLGIDLGQKEKVGSVDAETGEFKEIEEWRFLNTFTGADLAKQQYQFKIRTLSAKYQETHNEVDKQALADIQEEYNQHLIDFWHQEHTPEFYKVYEPFKRDAIGRKAQMEMDKLSAEIDELLSDYVSTEDEIIVSQQLESLRRQIKQLSSLRNIFGELKTGEELEIAKRIQEFNERSKNVYDVPVEIPDAFENSYWNYRQKLADEGKLPGSDIFNEQLDNWKELNTRIVVEESFWETLGDVNNRIKSILDTLPNDVSKKLEIEEAYLEIKSILTGNKDESGQPVGDEMSEESLGKIKAAQERILKAQEFLNKTTGLTRSEKMQLENIFLGIASGKANAADYVKLSQLMDKQEIIGLDKVKRAALRGLYAKLEELKHREPTQAYIDTVNSYLKGMEDNPLFDKIKSTEITKTNAYVILNDSILDILFAQSPEFERWFKTNHLKKPGIDQETGLEVEKWEKTYAWNVLRPNEEKYLKKTYIKDEEGNVLDEIVGLPSMKYFKKLVKEEFKTQKIVGETVDNAGRWLPRTVAQKAKDDRFINKEYTNLFKQNSAKFRLLEKTKEIYLRNQEDAHPEARLYYAYPRYSKEGLERLGSEKPVDRITQKVKDFWTGVKDKWGEGMNFEGDVQYTKMDLFDSETSGIPIAGLAKMDLQEVSTDILQGMMRYMYSAQRQKKLIEIAPTVKAIQQVVNNKKNFPFVQKAMGSRTVVNINKRKDKSVMAEAINNIVDKTFEGKQQIGWGSETQWLQNLSNTMFKQASFAYLALNIPSATKNALSMKWQGLIEAVSGKHFSFKDFIAAEGIATSTTMQISSEIYKKGSKSINVQLVEAFDPERDRFKSQIGESLSRTALKDTLKPLERMNDYRKWVQLQASLQTFFALMGSTKVEQNGKTIPYSEAWEVKDGKLQLKEGIDPSWGITYDSEGNQLVGKIYKQKRNEFQGVLDNLNGAMGAENKAEVERYLLGRFLMFFRRWMTRMFINRFGYSGSLLNGTVRGRLDPTLGDTKQGWYITNLQFLYKTFKTFGKYAPYATKEEKEAIIRLTSEIGTLLLISALLPAMFDYDPDDKDRFKKLRAKSGAIPLPFVDEEASKNFQLGGWLSNHLLLLVMQTRAEQNQFLPFPGLGLDNYTQYLNLQSLATGPTLNTYATLAKDLGYMVSGSDKQFYKKDANAYEWGRADERKIWTHIAKAVGLSGSHIDPSQGIKNFENIQNR